MKGRTPTHEEKRLWDRIAGIGCIACRHDGRHNPVVSIHHIDGRTKPLAHKLVLPLCAGHHQAGTGAPNLVAVHPDKGKFQRMYGRQEDLVREVYALIDEECPI